ncbi:MAG: DegT/DnrJ/EryC1/StrS family aminotransferase [Deltaproteobacteria bacterium]|nr:DegT/DnrJ/EryC1/StrS family aminotransferase [Deltaproteobacteria bacterium]
MKWKVSLADIDLGQDEINAVVKVLKSKWLTMGPITEKFEKEFAKHLGIRYAFAVSNCTAALHIAHQVLGITNRDEVICPALTFVATANSILYTGAKPVFADIAGLDDLNISPESILKKITSKTKAITVVHYGGYPCNMGKIMQIAKKYRLYVIEDAAHAPGAEYDGKKIGTIGDFGCFSFFSNKNMTTGEGGMIVTNNARLAKKIKVIRSHGMTTLTWDRYKGHSSTYDVIDLGYNYRIDEIRSAMGLAQLEKLDKNNERRKSLVQAYIKHLRGVPGTNIPFRDFVGKSSYHLFPILLKNSSCRKKLLDGLRKKGIQTSIHYPPIHLFKYYREKFGFKKGLLPKTEEVFNRELTLPLYPSLSSRDLIYIVNYIKDILIGK